MYPYMDLSEPLIPQLHPSVAHPDQYIQTGKRVVGYDKDYIYIPVDNVKKI